MQAPAQAARWRKPGRDMRIARISSDTGHSKTRRTRAIFSRDSNHTPAHSKHESGRLSLSASENAVFDHSPIVHRSPCTRPELPDSPAFDALRAVTSQAVLAPSTGEAGRCRASGGQGG